MTILIEELKRILGEAPVKVKHHFDPAYDDWVGGEMVLEEGYVEVVERLTALRNALPAIIARLENVERLQKDSERLDWVLDYCMYLPQRNGHHLSENSREEIDKARKGKEEGQ